MCRSREGRILELRLRGMGFYPEDAITLARLWEAGHSRRELVDAAIGLGYEPGPNLEAAFEAAVRPSAHDDHG